WHLVLPYPPSANRYWRHVGRNVVVRAEARKYRQGVKLRALTAGIRPLAGELVVSAGVYRPQRRGDLDNTLKVVFDALNGVAWGDDSQVIEVHARRYDDRANPRIELSVEVAG